MLKLVADENRQKTHSCWLRQSCKKMSTNLKTRTRDFRPRNWFSALGLILLLVPIYSWTIWIRTFNSNPTASHADKVQMYLSNLPTFLRGISLSVYELAFGIAAILLAIFGRKKPNGDFRAIDIFVIVIASLLLFLQLFTMM